MNVALARGGSYKRWKNQGTSDESREASYNLKVRKRRTEGGGGGVKEPCLNRLS